eukprot:4222287-Prymnesium_polylepis.2
MGDGHVSPLLRSGLVCARPGLGLRSPGVQLAFWRSRGGARSDGGLERGCIRLGHVARRHVRVERGDGPSWTRSRPPASTRRSASQRLRACGLDVGRVRRKGAVALLEVRHEGRAVRTVHHRVRQRAAATLIYAHIIIPVKS